MASETIFLMDTLYCLSNFKGTCLDLALNKWGEFKMIHPNEIKSSVCLYVLCVWSVCVRQASSSSKGTEYLGLYPVVRNSLAMIWCNTWTFSVLNTGLVWDTLCEDPFFAFSATGISVRWYVCSQSYQVHSRVAFIWFTQKLSCSCFLSADIRVFI